MNRENRSERMREICLMSRVMPVLKIDRLEDAIPLAEALFESGLKVIEVTLRTPCALEAMQEISRKYPDGVVGAGTVLTEEQLVQARQAGAVFGVSPGATKNLMQSAIRSELPFLPAAMTMSEMMELYEMGFPVQKLFPATAMGVSYLKSVCGPLPDLSFCPTGGIRAETAPDFLSLPNVLCVGGSWMVPANLIESKDWGAIKEMAKTAAGL